MLGRTIALATLVSGTLDILSAFVFAGIAGVGPVAVLHSVASGPFGNKVNESGIPGAALGLATHFSIMTVMVTVFAFACAGWPRILRTPLFAGIAYGLILYGIMYWIVLPLRWPTVFPQVGWWKVGNALFSHIVCVGVPMAYVMASRLGSPAATTQASAPVG
jgi:hypothetical protein